MFLYLWIRYGINDVSSQLFYMISATTQPTKTRDALEGTLPFYNLCYIWFGDYSNLRVCSAMILYFCVVATCQSVLRQSLRVHDPQNRTDIFFLEYLSGMTKLV